MTMTAEELAIVRRAYAKQVLAAMQVKDGCVEAAFAAAPREDFLGPGPWLIYRFWDAHVATPSPDPVYLYTNDLVGAAGEGDERGRAAYPAANQGYSWSEWCVTGSARWRLLAWGV